MKYYTLNNKHIDLLNSLNMIQRLTDMLTCWNMIHWKQTYRLTDMLNCWQVQIWDHDKSNCWNDELCKTDNMKYDKWNCWNSRYGIDELLKTEMCSHCNVNSHILKYENSKVTSTNLKTDMLKYDLLNSDLVKYDLVTQWLNGIWLGDKVKCYIMI